MESAGEAGIKTATIASDEIEINLITENHLGWRTHDYVIADSPEFGPNSLGKIMAFGGESGEWLYVHYCKRDRRNDRWVHTEQVEFLGHNMRKEKEARNCATDFDTMHKYLLKVRNIPSITLGSNEIRCWYYSPYPAYCFGKHLYICEHCFRYFTMKEMYEEHIQKETKLTPPGREVYREGNISIFQIFGIENLLECQCLSLLCKLFLDHKTLYYMDMESYVFYVLCQTDTDGCHLAAFFSKHINSANDDILSCIVVLPPYQRMGFSSILISLAYEIARRGGHPGGPEEPLSDLGELTFMSFWRDDIVSLVLQYGEISKIDVISKMTGFKESQINMTLTKFHLVKGEDEHKKLVWNMDAVRYYATDIKHMKRIDPMLLIWLPDDDFNEYKSVDAPPPAKPNDDRESEGVADPRNLKFTVGPNREYGRLRVMVDREKL